MQIVHTVRTVFAPYGVIADVRTPAQCTAMDVDRDIATGEFCNNAGDCAAMSKALAAMRIVDNGRPEQTLGQVNEMGNCLLYTSDAADE